MIVTNVVLDILYGFLARALKYSQAHNVTEHSDCMKALFPARTLKFHHSYSVTNFKMQLDFLNALRMYRACFSFFFF
jgi:hypothetical protein